MFKSIVVPLDGSAFGERALPIATRIAIAHGAALHFVHVHALIPPGMYMVGNAPFAREGARSWSGWHDAEVREREKDYLARVAARIDKAVAAATFELSMAVGLTEGLQAFAESWHADLIIMATHRSIPFEKILFGTNGGRVVRDLRLPTILVPADDSELLPATEPTLQKILIPLDGSSFAEEVLEAAEEAARGVGAEIILLGVANPVDELEAVATPLRAALHISPAAIFPLDSYLADVERELRLAGTRATTDIVRSSDAAAAILDYAGMNGVDLIAIATHARSAASRFFRKSVAARVVRSSRRPVMLLHPQYSKTAWLDHTETTIHQ